MWLDLLVVAVMIAAFVILHKRKQRNQHKPTYIRI